MITTPEGIQKLMSETREDLIARVCSMNVLIRRERINAKRDVDDARSAKYKAEREAEQALEVLKPLQRMVDKLETVLDVLRATGGIDEKTADILYEVVRDDDNYC